jgi:hypothetical protein
MTERKADMRFNAMFAELVDVAALEDVTTAQLPELFRSAVADGWTVDERGAFLLRRFLATYSGSPETDVTGYEAAVNGRGVPDLDLAVTGRARANALARRGVGFARAALGRLDADYPDHPEADAYVSIAEVEGDGEILYVADVTFVTTHPGEPPYLEAPESVTANGVLVVGNSRLSR